MPFARRLHMPASSRIRTSIYAICGTHPVSPRCPRRNADQSVFSFFFFNFAARGLNWPLATFKAASAASAMPESASKRACWYFNAAAVVESSRAVGGDFTGGGCDLDCVFDVCEESDFATVEKIAVLVNVKRLIFCHGLPIAHLAPWLARSPDGFAA